MPTEDKASEALGKIQKKVTIASVAVLGVVAIFTLVTLIFFTAAKSEEAKQKSRISEASAQINSQQSTEELLTVVGKKAEVADKAITTRLVYTDILNKIATLMPQNVYFGDFKLEGPKISTTAKAKTSADVAGLVSSFVSSEEGKKLFSSVTIDSLASVSDQETGQLVYSFTLTLEVVTANPNPVPAGADPTIPGGGNTEIEPTEEAT